MIKNYFVLFISCILVLSCQSQHDKSLLPSAELKFLNNKTSCEIPFERFRDWIIIKARVNDKKVYSFILDTGAPIAALSSEIPLEGLNLNIAGNINLKGVDPNKASSVPLATGVKFSIGDIEITNALMAAGLSSDAITGIDGIIGKCIFENAIVKINWAKKTITIAKPDSFKYAGNGSILPLELSSNGHITTEVEIEASGEKLKLKADVDIGNRADIHVDKKTGISLLKQGASLKNIIVGWGANGFAVGDVNRTTLTLPDGSKFANVITTYRDANDELFRAGVRANIGLSILERFDLIFDYPGKRLILEKNNNYSKPFIFNQSGIIINPRPVDGYVLIEDIIPSSPADEAGLKKNDRIIIVSEIVPDIKNIDQVDRILNGKASDNFKLTIQRGQQKISTEIKCRRLI